MNEKRSPLKPNIRNLVLASASPRRQELLERIGISAEIVTSCVEETDGAPGENPADICLRNARSKTREVATRVPSGNLVLAADTIVVIDGRILGKPTDPADATRMLRRLSGRFHQVMTGYVVLEAPDGERTEGVVTTEVLFKQLSDEDIAGYIATGEPFDKAGSYGIQGVGVFLVRCVQGSYTNVVGLPLAEVLEALERMGGPRPFSAADQAVL